MIAVGRGARSVVCKAREERLEAEQPRKTECDARQYAHWLLRRNAVSGVDGCGQHGLRLRWGELGSSVVGAHGGLFINLAWKPSLRKRRATPLGRLRSI